MKKFISLFVVLACVLVISARMHAQDPVRSSVTGDGGVEAKDVDYQQLNQASQPIGPVQTVPVNPYNPALNIMVNPNLQLDQGTLAIYQQMANALNGLTSVPDARMTYYSAYTNSNTETITGWSAFVENVQPNCYGYLVAISVVPGISSSNYGPAAIMVGANYIETFQVTNGQVTYIASQDPDATAGQQFYLMGL